MRKDLKLNKIKFPTRCEFHAFIKVMMQNKYDMKHDDQARIESGLSEDEYSAICMLYDECVIKYKVFKKGIKFKCQYCGTEFEPTKYELHLINNYPRSHSIDRVDYYQPIPFCSPGCFRLRDPYSAMPCHDELWYHNGPVNRNIDFNKLDAFGIDGLRIRPITKEEIYMTEKMRGRGGFSDGASVLVLPSSTFYGRGKGPIHWK